jgi:hypothetical protein
MAFITRCSANLRKLGARIALFTLACSLAGAVAPARADILEFKQARLAPREEGWALEADFDIELSGRIEEALNKGVALYFNLDFELTRPRWYWLDEKAAQLSQTYRLDYHALTRQYRLSAGSSSLYFSFPSLTDALNVLQQPKVFAVERSKVVPGETYDGNVRLRLDVTRLPKPFQIETFTNREWTLDSGWKKFPFKAEAAGAGVSPAAAAGPVGSAGPAK